MVPAAADAAQIEEWARSNPRIRELIGDAAIRKVIIVPGKLVNFVV
jgi:leucyl-tRNA synthetase